jgi:hypothetical protein
MKNDLRYSVEDCFETFNFFDSDQLSRLGENLSAAFLDFQARNNCGLRRVYDSTRGAQNLSEEGLLIWRIITEIDQVVFNHLEITIAPEYSFISNEAGWCFSYECKKVLINRLFEVNRELND